MATEVRRKYVVNEKGEPVSVLLDIKAYRKMMEELEELDSIRAYDAARCCPGEAIPFDQAVQEIKNSRR